MLEDGPEIARTQDEMADLEWVGFLGFTLGKVSNGSCELSCVPKLGHLNHNGTVSGAVLLGLAEVAAGAAVVGEDLEGLADRFIVSSAATIRFLGPSRGLLRVSAIWPDGPDKPFGAASICEVDVSVSDASGQVTCTATIELVVRSRRSER
jgi:acyl-coenzyme A thioesterase PaaI-like protein